MYDPVCLYIPVHFSNYNNICLVFSVLQYTFSSILLLDYLQNTLNMTFQ